MIKFDRHAIMRKDRTTLRNSQKKLRGEGVIILTSKERKNLTFKELEPMKMVSDAATK